MQTIQLTAKEKSTLEKYHHSCKDRKEGDRIKAVLLRSEGWTIPLISQALRIHQTTVTRHLNDYEGGKLRIESGGSDSALNASHTEELVEHLALKTYQCTHEVITYVAKTYSVIYSVPGMNKWLHRNGFSYKKPKGYPYKADKEKQENFIAEYERLKGNIGPDDSIMFMDSCHPSMSTKITHGWIKRGENKALETTASRTRVNLVGALALGEISQAIVTDYETVNGESIVNFMGHVRKRLKSKRKIHLILDGAGYHRSEIVREAAKRLNMKLFFLPPYSPNLNPIERLWKVMNEKVRNNKFFRTAQEFRTNIAHFFKKTVPKIGGSLDSRINDNFQKLDYAF